MAKSDSASGIKICCIGAGYVGGERERPQTSLLSSFLFFRFNRCCCSRVHSGLVKQLWRAVFQPADPPSTLIPHVQGVENAVSLSPMQRYALFHRFLAGERRRLSNWLLCFLCHRSNQLLELEKVEERNVSPSALAPHLGSLSSPNALRVRRLMFPCLRWACKAQRNCRRDEKTSRT